MGTVRCETPRRARIIPAGDFFDNVGGGHYNEPILGNMSQDLQSLIRNFSIIAHIDHGKSTLADRLLDATGAVTAREAKEQILDAMDLERERGITIKAHAVAIRYKAQDGKTYLLHLIDTPGHVDFTYEVSRSLCGVRGIAPAGRCDPGCPGPDHRQREPGHGQPPHHHPGHQQDRSRQRRRRRHQTTDFRRADAGCHRCHAREREGRLGVPEVLEAIVKRIPPPSGDPTRPLKALIFDSWFDNYRGVIVLTRIIDGSVRPGMKIKVMSNDRLFEVTEVGQFTPKRTKGTQLLTGEVGYLCANMKEVADVKIGDTLTDAARRPTSRSPATKEVKPLVFCGLYSTDTARYEDLRDALLKVAAERFVPSFTSRKPRWRWDSDSAAGSSACSIWKSFRSGWSGNTG